MLQSPEHRLITLLKTHYVAQLPLVAAVLFESFKFMLMNKSSDTGLFILNIVQLTIEAFPLFAAHYWLVNRDGFKAWAGWMLGFAGYCLVWNILAENSDGFAQWTLLSGEGWILFTLLSVGYQLTQHLVDKKRSNRYRCFRDYYR